jgi:acyl carrier protein
MVPTSFVPVANLPRTPNGKVDRKNLPPPELIKGRHHAELAAPKRPLERELAAICANVLHLERVSVEASLFDLGADSLHLFQIVARAKDAGIDLTPKQILSARSISAIVDGIEASDVETRERSTPELVRMSRDRFRIQRSRLGGSELSDTRGQSRWDIR